MTKATEKQARRDEAAAHLRKLYLPAGATACTVLRHVARSGMSRSISVLVTDPRDGEIVDVTYWAAIVLDEKIDQRFGGIKMSGCGMDMGFALVYSLARALYPEGHECTGSGADRASRCPSNDHSNGMAYSVGRLHRDGGYALNHRWL